IKTTSLALTDSRIRFATVVLPEPVPPEMPMIMITLVLGALCFGLWSLVFGLWSQVQRSKYKDPDQKPKPSHTSTNRPYHSLQQFRKNNSHTLSCLHHFLMINRLVTDARSHVRDTGNSEHLETHVSRDDRFRHRTHPHRI